MIALAAPVRLGACPASLRHVRLCRYYDITCVQLNIVLASIGLPPSATCVDPPGDRIFIASVQVLNPKT